MTRQTLFERRPDWALLASAHTRIVLQPLDTRGSRELAGVLLQRLDPVPAALRELVIAGAEGNPFYMEELVRMLIDDGAIVTGEERWRVVPERRLSAHVPATLTGVLQQASVIGFVFWDSAGSWCRASTRNSKASANTRSSTRSCTRSPTKGC